MFSWIVLASLISFSHAQSENLVQHAISLMPSGKYEGVTPHGEACTVELWNASDFFSSPAIEITVAKRSAVFWDGQIADKEGFQIYVFAEDQRTPEPHFGLLKSKKTRRTLQISSYDVDLKKYQGVYIQQTNAGLQIQVREGRWTANPKVLNCEQLVR